jgi:hypothetical protein
VATSQGPLELRSAMWVDRSVASHPTDEPDRSESPLVTPGGPDGAGFLSKWHPSPPSALLAFLPLSIFAHPNSRVSSFVTPPSHFRVTPGSLNLKVPEHTLSFPGTTRSASFSGCNPGGHAALIKLSSPAIGDFVTPGQQHRRHVAPQHKRHGTTSRSERRPRR